MKNLTDVQIKEISEGTFSLDHQNRDFIRTELSYGYALVSHDPTPRLLKGMDFKLAEGGVIEFYLRVALKAFL